MSDLIDRVAKDINVPCTDTISRQAAIDAIDEYIEKNRRPDFIGNMVWVSGVADAMRIVSDLPSVQPVEDIHREKEQAYYCGYEDGAKAARSAQPETEERMSEMGQNVPNDELISKKVAIDAIERNAYRHTYIDQIVGIIKELPSVQPENMCVNLDIQKIATHKSDFSDLDELPSVQEQKKGWWIDCVGSDHWKCSECGDRAPMYWDANRQEYDEWFSPYCPNCGCAMTEGAEDDPEERTEA